MKAFMKFRFIGLFVFQIVGTFVCKSMLHTLFRFAPLRGAYLSCLAKKGTKEGDKERR